MKLYTNIKSSSTTSAVVTLVLLGYSCIETSWAQTVDAQLTRTKNAQLFNDNEVNVCPSVGPLLFGDIRYHIGCHLMEHMKNINQPYFEASNLFAQDKMKPASVDKIAEKNAKRLLNSTDQVNSNGVSMKNSTINPDDSRTLAVNCCDVASEVVYPLFGFSLSSNTIVRIVQDQLQQAFVYRRCLSGKTAIVHGRCHQGSLPRLTYVYHSKDSQRLDGRPYFQDLVLMPSNCECLISLPSSEAK